MLGAPCPDCGLTAGDVAPSEVAHRVQADLPRWSAVLERDDARERPEPATWSPTEYACHVRDVHELFAQRIRLMLDETAIAQDYASQDPMVVATQLVTEGETMVELLGSIPADAWERTGVRSNGSEFTIATLTQYYLHDIVHHLHDVRG